MRRGSLIGRLLILGLSVVVLVGIAAAAVPYVKEWWKPPESHAALPRSQEASLELVSGKAGTFRLNSEVVRTLGVQTDVVRTATRSRLLKLSGSLTFDPNYYVRPHPRFPGEVVQIGEVEAPREHGSALSTELRPIRFNDKVKKNDLLVAVWSRELGEKKSDLIDALSQQHVDEQLLAQMSKYKDSLPARTILELEAKVAMDHNAVLKAERTLRVWRLTQEEIDDIKQEAQRLFLNRQKGLPVKLKDWARVEYRAPFAGTVLEKNVNVGDYVDTSTELFKIADLAHLSVWAHAYEEDLPVLQSLTPEQRRWTISLQADPGMQPLPGMITTIGSIIDPTQHTALVMGHVDNIHGQMLVGQYVTATVALPPPADEVEIPTSALIEDGSSSMVLVQAHPDRPEFTLRKVAVARRTEEWVCLRTRLKADEQRQGLDVLRPNERVVTAGALELASALSDLQSAHKK